MDGLCDSAIAGQGRVGESLAQLHTRALLEVHGLKQDQRWVREVLWGEGNPPKPRGLSEERAEGWAHTEPGSWGGWEQLPNLCLDESGGSQAVPSSLWGLRMAWGCLALSARTEPVPIPALTVRISRRDTSSLL